MSRSPLGLPFPSIPSADDVVGAAKELGYIAVGFGILGFQRLQVRRRELERSAAPVLRIAREAVPCMRRAGDARQPQA